LGANREIVTIGRGLGCWGEGVAEMLRWESLVLAKVSAVAWRARIWGREAAAVCVRGASGGGSGVRRGWVRKGVRVRCRGYVQSDVRVIAQRLRGVAVGLLAYGW